jgi:hypothetical protein
MIEVQQVADALGRWLLVVNFDDFSSLLTGEMEKISGAW